MWVPEWHKRHGLHAHVALGGWIDQAQLADVWGHGFVKASRPAGDVAGLGELGQARMAAGYLSKYVAKSFEDERRIEGLHRYDVARGHKPEIVALTGSTRAEVLETAAEVMGGRPAHVWTSEDAAEWESKPPAVWASWE